MAAWDLEKVALDFHDRNCVDCNKRKPVSLPNISKLVDSRDRAKAEHLKQLEAAEKRRAEELSGRDQVRQKIRSQLSPIQATVVDQIAELDNDPTERRAEKLTETARVAPEHFTTEIQEHLSELLEVGGHSRTVGCLSALDLVSDDLAMICNAALKAMARYYATDLAAHLISKNIVSADSELVAGALPALIGLSNPRRYPAIGGATITRNREPLWAVYRAFPEEVAAGLKLLVEKPSANDVEEAARGIKRIGEIDSEFLFQFVRPLTAKLVRAKHLLKDLDGRDHEPISNIRGVIVSAFLVRANEVDELLQTFWNEADDQGRARTVDIYEGILRNLISENEPTTDAHRIAFHRIIWMTTSDIGPETLSELQMVFSGGLYGLQDLASEEIENLLGAAALLDDIINAPASELQDVRPAGLVELQRLNRNTVLNGIQDTLIEWACTAASTAGRGQVTELVEFYKNLPDDRESLKACVIGNLDHVCRGADSLNAILPELYAALVGNSQLLRAIAANTIGEIAGRHPNDLPDLVYEAFVPLLSDPYVLVHKAAARALRSFWLPDGIALQARQALTQLVLTYATKRSDDRFLMDCMDILIGRYMTLDELAGPRGTAIVGILGNAESGEVGRIIRFRGPRLRGAEGYVQLIVRLLEAKGVQRYHFDDIIFELEQLPLDLVRANISILEQAGISIIAHHRTSAPVLIEILSRAGAWDEAARIARAVYDSIDDTTQNKPRKLNAGLLKAATEYEAAIAAGDRSALVKIGECWNTAIREREADIEENKQRRDPLRGVLGEN
ncbi:MAG: hypothetical protein GY807_03460 [Gammaproteobacteria bacterium]|nr:hypothetical protein [Gammaproteobacteria bacterium]